MSLTKEANKSFLGERSVKPHLGLPKDLLCALPIHSEIIVRLNKGTTTPQDQEYIKTLQKARTNKQPLSQAEIAILAITEDPFGF